MTKFYISGNNVQMRLGCRTPWRQEVWEQYLETINQFKVFKTLFHQGIERTGTAFCNNLSLLLKLLKSICDYPHKVFPSKEFERLNILFWLLILKQIKHSLFLKENANNSINLDIIIFNTIVQYLSCFYFFQILTNTVVNIVVHKYLCRLLLLPNYQVTCKPSFLLYRCPSKHKHPHDF